jgi:hypothetical protein
MIGSLDATRTNCRQMAYPAYETEFREQADFRSPFPRLLMVASDLRGEQARRSCCVSDVARALCGPHAKSGFSGVDGRSICTAGVTEPGLVKLGAGSSRVRANLRPALVMTTSTSDRAPAEWWDESDKWLGGPAIEGRTDQAYGEHAFRYFLGLERKRAERAGRSLLLLLVSLESESGSGSHVSNSIAIKLFSGLGQCVRDVDFIGWYRHEQVAGAVLTQGTDSPGLEAAEQIRQRVIEGLGDCLPAHTAKRLQVRLLQVRQRQQE